MQIDLMKSAANISMMIKSNKVYMNETKSYLTVATGKALAKLDPIQNMDVKKIDLSNVQYIKASLL